MISDQELWIRLVANHDDAYKIAYKKCLKDNINYLAKFNLSENEMIEIYQDSWVSISQKIALNKLTLNSSLCALVNGFVKNKLKSFQKQRQNSSFIDIDQQDFPDNEVDETHVEENFKNMQTILDQLTPMCRALLIDFYIHQLSVDQLINKYNRKDAANIYTQKSKCLHKAKSLSQSLSI